MVVESQTLISHGETILRLCLAILLGGLIGLERERTSWFAGLRTHMLVCTGSTLIMIVSQYGFVGVLHENLVVLDPSRIAAQVVSGIGFLGAGTILFWKNMIRGLTTAASLWAVAAVGLAIGGGLYLAAISATLIMLIVLAGVKPLEKMIAKKHYVKEVTFITPSGVSLVDLDTILLKLNLRSYLTNLQIDSMSEKEKIHLFFKNKPEINLLEIVEELKKITKLDKIEIIE